MSKLYATIQADRSHTTRTSTHMIQATTQTWRGSCSVETNGEGFRISLGPGSTPNPNNYSRRFTYEELADILSAGKED